MQMLCSNFVQPTIACNTKKTLLVSGVCLRDMLKAATVSLSPVLVQVCIWLLSRLGLEFGHIARFSMTPLSPSKLGSLPQPVQSSSVFGFFVAGVHTPLHAIVHGEKYRVRGSTVALPWEPALLRPTIRGARRVHGTGADSARRGAIQKSFVAC